MAIIGVYTIFRQTHLAISGYQKHALVGMEKKSAMVVSSHMENCEKNQQKQTVDQ